MRLSDLIETSLNSLRQRRFRTALTVLGVLIGTMAVVVMISLGVGMTQSVMDSISSNSAMTRVTVYPGGGYREGPSDGKEKVLNTKTISELSQLPGVERVTPVYEVSATVKVDGKEGWVQIRAMSADGLAAEGFELAQGRLPQPGDGLAFLFGSKVKWNFPTSDAMGAPPDIDWMNKQLFLTFDTGSYPEPGQPAAPAKRFISSVTGVLAGNDQTWSENDQYAFADLDQVLSALRKAMPGKALPGQPATTDGKPKGNDFHYSQLHLNAESVERAESLTTELREEGYQVFSNIELMREIQQQSMIIQAVFGGIGFISLLVAAIGIANTMMMSVYERTKQIGIMKVLGASLTDIRNMFLLESAFIGVLGGVIGLILSLLLSAGLNATLGAAAGGGPGMEMKISVIPIWLAISSVGFAALIGTLAGVMPAQRAMRLSPLAAIRSE